MSLPTPPPAVVVDASVMIEALLGSPRWLEHLDRWQDDGALVLAPPHFRLETANALLRSVRLQPTDAMARLGALFDAGVETADRGLPGVLDALELAARHGLTVCDAAYLQLALELDGALATLDRPLSHAARAEGVTLID